MTSIGAACQTDYPSCMEQALHITSSERNTGSLRATGRPPLRESETATGVVASREGVTPGGRRKVRCAVVQLTESESRVENAPRALDPARLTRRGSYRVLHGAAWHCMALHGAAFHAPLPSHRCPRTAGHIKPLANPNESKRT